MFTRYVAKDNNDAEYLIWSLILILYNCYTIQRKSNIPKNLDTIPNLEIIIRRSYEIDFG